MGRVEGVVLERGRVLAGGHLCREVGARLVILFRMHVAKKIILSCISTPFSLTITSNVQNNTPNVANRQGVWVRRGDWSDLLDQPVDHRLPGARRWRHDDR